MQCSFPAQLFPRWSPHLLVLLLAVASAATAACPATLTPALDPPTKGYLSPVVFAGRLTALARKGSSLTRAEFAVERILKGLPEAVPALVVEFAAEEKVAGRENRRRPRCQGYHAREGELRTGQRYVVFAAWRRPRRMIAVASPEPNSRRKAVAKVLCANCAKAPTVRNLKDAKVEMHAKLKLKCRISGNPPPRVTWFKNGLRVKAEGRIKVRSKRWHSHLVINRVSFEDGGEYECQASNVLGNATASAVVTINTTTDWVFEKAPCPKNNYCLNGGVCSYFETVREYVCECAEGYRGRRCESKATSILNIDFYEEE